MQVDGLIENARTKVRVAEPETVACEIDRYLVLDVREPGEVLFGFLPGAIHIPRGTIEFRVSEDPRVADTGQPILVYSGHGRRSSLATLTLLELGFSNVQTLAGGFERWSAENRPID